MGAILNYSAFRSGDRTGAGRKAVEPVVAEIIAALAACGGAAHRDVIANSIASSRAGRPVAASRELRDEINDAFERHLDQFAARPSAARLCKPLGSDSYRWSLTLSAKAIPLVSHPSKLRRSP